MLITHHVNNYILFDETCGRPWFTKVSVSPVLRQAEHLPWTCMLESTLWSSSEREAVREACALIDHRGKAPGTPPAQEKV